MANGRRRPSLDGERVKINENVWTEGSNSATLGGAGVALNWIGSHQLSAKACLATSARIGTGACRGEE